MKRFKYRFKIDSAQFFTIRVTTDQGFKEYFTYKVLITGDTEDEILEKFREVAKSIEINSDIPVAEELKQYLAHLRNSVHLRLGNYGVVWDDPATDCSLEFRKIHPEDFDRII